MTAGNQRNRSTSRTILGDPGAREARIMGSVAKVVKIARLAFFLMATVMLYCLRDERSLFSEFFRSLAAAIGTHFGQTATSPR